MDKDFSEGFMLDIADLLECCVENNTDNVDLIFTFRDKELSVLHFQLNKTDILRRKGGT